MSNSCDPMDYSLPGFSVHRILQARILEWVAISFSRGSSQPRNQTWVSCIAGRFFTDWATREALGRTDNWSWSSSSLATWFEELTHWKRPWCWERLKAGGEVDDRGWDGWTASPTRWTWVWASSGSWWWTGKPGMLRSMWLQRAGHDWATELNWRCVVMCISTEQAHIKDTELAVIVLIITVTATHNVPENAYVFYMHCLI